MYFGFFPAMICVWLEKRCRMLQHSSAFSQILKHIKLRLRKLNSLSLLFLLRPKHLNIFLPLQTRRPSLNLSISPRLHPLLLPQLIHKYRLVIFDTPACLCLIQIFLILSLCLWVAVREDPLEKLKLRIFEFDQSFLAFESLLLISKQILFEGRFLNDSALKLKADFLLFLCLFLMGEVEQEERFSEQA